MTGVPRGAGPALAVAAAVLLLSGLGGTDLWAPDEPRYAAVAENVRVAESAADRVLLRLNGEAYTQKPPLYFWLAALAGSASGRVTEVAARLPSAIAGIALVALVATAGARMFGQTAALVAGAMLLTTWDVAHLARRAQLDVLLTLFTTLALFAFWQLDRARPDADGRTPGRVRLQLVLHTSLGFAVLTKGPVGLLIPGLVAIGFLAHEGRLRDIRRACPAWGFAISLGPALLWVAAATALAPPGYFDSAIVDNLWGRFFQGTSHARPFYYFLYQFPIHFLPWTPLWVVVVWSARRSIFAPNADPERATAWRFALIWIAVTLVFFSLSAGKRALYLLPAFPATAMLCADAVLLALRDRLDVPRRITIGLAAIAVSIAMAALIGPLFTTALGIEIPRSATALTVAWAIGSVAAWRAIGLATRHVHLRFGAVLAGVFALEWILFTAYLPALDREKSPREIAVAAAAHTEASEPIGLFKKRALVGGLNYYGQRRVVALSTPEDVEAFRAVGGRVIVVPAKYLAQVRSVAPAQVRTRSRSGRRELLVVDTADR